MNDLQVRSRLKELFPKAQNLSKERLDVYTSKLIAKLTEESTQEDLDNLITDLNDVVNFEQVAKQDDQLRTLLNKPKTQEMPKDEYGTVTKKVELFEDNDTPAWAKALQDEIKSLKAEKLTETIESRFRGHEALKGVPKEMLDLVKTPQTLDEVDTFANQIAEIYKDKQIKDRLNAFGVDSTPQGQAGKSIEVKPKTLADLEKEGIKIK